LWLILWTWGYTPAMGARKAIRAMSVCQNHLTKHCIDWQPPEEK
jgi:hypothetical protein